MAKKIPMTNERRERLLSWMMSKFEAKEDWSLVRAEVEKLHAEVARLAAKYRTAAEQKTLDNFGSGKDVTFCYADHIRVMVTTDNGEVPTGIFFDSSKAPARKAMEIFQDLPKIRRPEHITAGWVTLGEETRELYRQIIAQVEDILVERSEKRKELNGLLYGFRTIEEFEAKVMPLPEEIRSRVRPFSGTLTVVNDEQCTKLREDLSSVLAA